MLDPISTSRPITPVSDPISPPKLPTPDLQNRISSFTELSTSEKAGLFVAFFALVASLIFYLKKISNPLSGFPEDIQAWVRKNFKDWRFDFQQVACEYIKVINEELDRDPTSIYRLFQGFDKTTEKYDQSIYRKFKVVLIRYVEQTYPHIVYPYTPETSTEIRDTLMKKLSSEDSAKAFAKVLEIEQNADFLKDPFAYIRACRSRWNTESPEVKSAIEHYFEPRLNLTR